MDFITEDQNSQCSFLLSHVTQPAKPSALDSTDHSRSSKTNTNYWWFLSHLTVPKLLSQAISLFSEQNKC